MALISIDQDDFERVIKFSFAKNLEMKLISI